MEGQRYQTVDYEAEYEDIRDHFERLEESVFLAFLRDGYHLHLSAATVRKAMSHWKTLSPEEWAKWIHVPPQEFFEEYGKDPSQPFSEEEPSKAAAASVVVTSVQDEELPDAWIAPANEKEYRERWEEETSSDIESRISVEEFLLRSTREAQAFYVSRKVMVPVVVPSFEERWLERQSSPFPKQWRPAKGKVMVTILDRPLFLAEGQSIVTFIKELAEWVGMEPTDLTIRAGGRRLSFSISSKDATVAQHWSPKSVLHVRSDADLLLRTRKYDSFLMSLEAASSSEEPFSERHSSLFLPEVVDGVESLGTRWMIYQRLCQQIDGIRQFLVRYHWSTRDIPQWQEEDREKWRDYVCDVWKQSFRDDHDLSPTPSSLLSSKSQGPGIPFTQEAQGGGLEKEDCSWIEEIFDCPRLSTEVIHFFWGSTILSPYPSACVSKFLGEHEMDLVILACLLGKRSLWKGDQRGDSTIEEERGAEDGWSLQTFLLDRLQGSEVPTIDDLYEELWQKAETIVAHRKATAGVYGMEEETKGEDYPYRQMATWLHLDPSEYGWPEGEEGRTTEIGRSGKQGWTTSGWSSLEWESVLKKELQDKVSCLLPIVQRRVLSYFLRVVEEAHPVLSSEAIYLRLLADHHSNPAEVAEFLGISFSETEDGYPRVIQAIEQRRAGAQHYLHLLHQVEKKASSVGEEIPEGWVEETYTGLLKQHATPFGIAVYLGLCGEDQEEPIKSAAQWKSILLSLLEDVVASAREPEAALWTEGNVEEGEHNHEKEEEEGGMDYSIVYGDDVEEEDKESVPEDVAPRSVGGTMMIKKAMGTSSLYSSSLSSIPRSSWEDRLRIEVLLHPYQTTSELYDTLLKEYGNVPIKVAKFLKIPLALSKVRKYTGKEWKFMLTAVLQDLLSSARREVEEDRWNVSMKPFWTTLFHSNRNVFPFPETQCTEEERRAMKYHLFSLHRRYPKIWSLPWVGIVLLSVLSSSPSYRSVPGSSLFVSIESFCTQPDASDGPMTFTDIVRRYVHGITVPKPKKSWSSLRYHRVSPYTAVSIGASSVSPKGIAMEREKGGAKDEKKHHDAPSSSASTTVLRKDDDFAAVTVLSMSGMPVVISLGAHHTKGIRAGTIINEHLVPTLWSPVCALFRNHEKLTEDTVVFSGQVLTIRFKLSAFLGLQQKAAEHFGITS